MQHPALGHVALERTASGQGAHTTRREVVQSVPWLLASHVGSSPSPKPRGVWAGSEAGWHSFWESLCHLRFCTSAVFFMKRPSGVVEHLLKPMLGTSQTLSNFTLAKTATRWDHRRNRGQTGKGVCPQVAQLLRTGLRPDARALAG